MRTAADRLGRRRLRPKLDTFPGLLCGRGLSWVARKRLVARRRIRRPAEHQTAGCRQQQDRDSGDHRLADQYRGGVEERGEQGSGCREGPSGKGDRRGHRLRHDMRPRVFGRRVARRSRPPAQHPGTGQADDEQQDSGPGVNRALHGHRGEGRRNLGFRPAGLRHRCGNVGASLATGRQSHLLHHRDGTRVDGDDPRRDDVGQRLQGRVGSPRQAGTFRFVRPRGEDRDGLVGPTEPRLLRTAAPRQCQLAGALRREPHCRPLAIALREESQHASPSAADAQQPLPGQCRVVGLAMLNRAEADDLHGVVVIHQYGDDGVAGGLDVVRPLQRDPERLELRLGGGVDVALRAGPG